MVVLAEVNTPRLMFVHVGRCFLAIQEGFVSGVEPGVVALRALPDYKVQLTTIVGNKLQQGEIALHKPPDELPSDKAVASAPPDPTQLELDLCSRLEVIETYLEHKIEA